MTNEKTIDTMNDQMVAVQGDHLIVLVPKMKMSKEQALRHAAWLVALAGDYDLEEFKKVFEAVCNT